MANTAVTATGLAPSLVGEHGNGVLRLPVVYKRCVIRVEAGRYTFELRAGALAGVDDPRRPRASGSTTAGTARRRRRVEQDDDLRDAVGELPGGPRRDGVGPAARRHAGLLRGPKS